MANVVRTGDTNIAGGIAQGGASTVYAEGAAVMHPGQVVTPHGCCGAPGCGPHCNATTTGGSSTVKAEGLPVQTSEDVDTCGHKRLTFAPTVFIGK